MSILNAAFAGATLLSVVIAQGTVSIQPQANLPNGASAPISPSFAGFGIESSNLFSFAGYANPNELSVNLLQNLGNYTGTPPHLRIGGNTQDYLYYSSTQDEWTWVNNPNSHGVGDIKSDSMLIGPRFFQAIDRFPKNTPITFGLNLAYEGSDYVEQITTISQKAVSGFSNVNLVSFEIGNEPDLYLQNGFRSGSWGGQVYTGQWLDRAYWVYDKVLQPAGLPVNFFEAAQTASTIGTSFQIEDLVQFDLTENVNGTGKPYLSSWNQHDYYYYIGVSTYPLTLDHMMTLSTTPEQFSAWTTQVQQADATPFPYALREMCSVGPIGWDGITNVFGASLWTLNFFMYAATLNISSVEMHMTDDSNASAWNPMDLYGVPPLVRPSYYAYAAFDQTIGPSCEARIYNLQLDLPDSYTGRVEGYSVYQSGTLASIVVINAMMVNASDTDKQSLTLQLSLPTQFAGQKLYLAYLTNDGADSKYNTTWNGISFEQSGNGLPTIISNDVQYVEIGSDGSATVTVRDTQAVVASIGSQVGDVQANESSCASMAAESGGTKSATSSAATSSNAANSFSSSKSSSTGGVSRISTMVLTTLISSLLTGVILLLA